MEKNKTLKEVTMKVSRLDVSDGLTNDLLFYGNTEIDGNTRLALTRNFYIMDDAISAMNDLARKTRGRNEHSAREIREDVYSQVEALIDSLELVQKTLKGDDDVF